MIDLNELAKQAFIVAKQRESNGGNIKTDTVSMLKHCASEVVEAVEAYTRSQWQLNKNEEEIELEHFSLELADIITCCLIISGKENIDIEVALNRVMEKNRLRAEKQFQKNEKMKITNINQESILKTDEELEKETNLNPDYFLGGW